MATGFSKKELTRYTLEAILIVFSVLLALFLDNVFEDRRESRTIDELVGHITDQMRSNLAVVDEWLPYHRAVIDEIDRHLSQQNVDVTLGRFAGFVFERQTHDPEQLVISLRILRNLLQELWGSTTDARHIRVEFRDEPRYHQAVRDRRRLIPGGGWRGRN